MDAFSFILGLAIGMCIGFVACFFWGLWLGGHQEYVLALVPLLVLAAPVHAQTITANIAPLHAVQITTVTPVSFTITGNPTPRPRDYFIVVPAGTPNGKEDFNTNPWKYLNNQTGSVAARPPAGLAQGTVTFQIAEVGKYEGRLYRRPDADAAPHVFLKAFPFEVTLSPITVSGVECTVQRKPDSASDEISLTIQSGKCSINASKSTPVTLDNKPGATP